jgi:hypothetical protein
MTEKSERLNMLKQEYIGGKCINPREIHAGFSERFNFFIDITDLEIPSVNGGRVTYLSELFELSRPVIGEWLSKDRPPKDSTLFDVAGFLAKHVSGGEKIPVALIVSWLRYGEKITKCPLKVGGNFSEPGEKAFLHVAANIVANEARKLHLSSDEYDLRDVLDRTISTLKDFQLLKIEDVKEIHRQIIRSHFPEKE